MQPKHSKNAPKMGGGMKPLPHQIGATLARIDWHAAFIATLETVAAISNLYGLVVVGELGQLYGSFPLAFIQNAPLLGLNAFFGAFVWMFAKAEPDRAMFAVVASILVGVAV